MGVQKKFRGRVIASTKKLSDGRIELAYVGLPGFTKEREVVSVADYEREVQRDYTPKQK